MLSIGEFKELVKGNTNKSLARAIAIYLGTEFTLFCDLEDIKDEEIKKIYRGIVAHDIEKYNIQDLNDDYSIMMARRANQKKQTKEKKKEKKIIIIDELLQSGSNGMQKDEKGDTIFKIVLEKEGNIEVLTQFINNGAYKDPKDIDNDEILTCYCHRYPTIPPQLNELYIKFIERGASITPKVFLTHIRLNNTPLLRYMINKGFVLEKNKQTLLLILNSNPEVIEFLCKTLEPDCDENDDHNSALVKLITKFPKLKFETQDIQSNIQVIAGLNYNVLAALCKYSNILSVELDNDKTLLHYAAYYGSPKTVMMLLHKKLDPNKADKFGMLPFMYAVVARRKENILICLTKTTNLDSYYNYKISYDELFTELDKNVFDSFLLRSVMNSTSNYYGSLFVDTTLPAMQVNIAKYVKAGLNLNMKIYRNNTLLSIAINLNDFETVSKLIELGVDPNVSYDNKKPLLLACEKGNIQIIKLLMNSKIPIDIKAKLLDGKTCLHIAAMKGDLEIAKFLVKSGADCLALDNENHTPLMTAIEYCQEKVGKYFVKKMSEQELNIQNIYGETALLIAAANNLSMMMINLIENGADIDMANLNGVTPFHLVCYQGDEFIFEYMMRRNANNFAKDNEGNSAIYYAKQNPNRSFYRKLKHYPMFQFKNSHELEKIVHDMNIEFV